MQSKPIAVVGGGTIGLSIALQLLRRGFRVQVLEAGSIDARRTGQASFAAAGMLSPTDPDRPSALRLFAAESLRLYDNFLREIEAASGESIVYQTEETVEYADDGSRRIIAERSLDPRQLHAALMTAVSRRGGDVRYGAAFDAADAFSSVVFAGGAWLDSPGLRGAVRPRKGQMLRLQIPEGLVLDRVHRAHDIYVVPRTAGPQQGSALVGATVEDCGFDLSLSAETLIDLRRRGARLIPELADAAAAPELESWAGLRPGTADGLPLIGAVPGASRQFVAAGHFRDGILLAPATCVAIADLIQGREPAMDLSPFDPARFGQGER